MKKGIFPIILILVIMALGSYSAFAEGMDIDYSTDIDMDMSMEAVEPIIERAKVLEINDLDEASLDNLFFTESMLVTVEMLTGDYKGQQFEVVHSLTGSYGYDIIVEPGDKVLVTVEDMGDGIVEVYISEYIRDTYIYIVFAIFVVLLILLGGFKGLKTILTLVLTIIMILKVLLPGLLAGYNPILLTVGVSFAITLITILVVGGMNKKSYAAIIGVLGGVFVAGLVAYIIGSKTSLTGLSNQEAMMLMYIPQGVNFDFRGLLFAGIIMGALGAVMDVGMSIASSMEEIKAANPDIATKDLVMSGMNVGKDIMGTMANTLILAYTGSTIPLLLLFTAYGESFSRIINLDLIATEIIRALAGSIGLILCIPLTAVVAGMLSEKNTKESKENS